MTGATTLDALARNARRVRHGGAGVPSPCLSVCQMQATNGLCAGCLRSLDEIAQWSGLADAGKRVVWARIEARISNLSRETE